ncbi:MAG: hypothetical protein MHM6MM_002147 [Cercozoa sp. M6MM]
MSYPYQQYQQQQQQPQQRTVYVQQQQPGMMVQPQPMVVQAQPTMMVQAQPTMMVQQPTMMAQPTMVQQPTMMVPAQQQTATMVPRHGQPQPGTHTLTSQYRPQQPMMQQRMMQPQQTMYAPQMQQQSTMYAPQQQQTMYNPHQQQRVNPYAAQGPQRNYPQVQQQPQYQQQQPPQQQYQQRQPMQHQQQQQQQQYQQQQQQQGLRQQQGMHQQQGMSATSIPSQQQQPQQLQHQATFAAATHFQQGVPTLRPHPSFDAARDAQALRQAMKGLGCNNKVLVEILGTRSNEQLQQVAASFSQQFNRNLRKDVKSETRNNFGELCNALLMTPAQFDAHWLRKAMKGLGTNENQLIEILCTRPQQRIREIKTAFEREYSRNLDGDVSSETSGDFRALLQGILRCERDESNTVDENLAKADARKLKEESKRLTGWKYSRVMEIFLKRNMAQLRKTWEEFAKISDVTIERALTSGMRTTDIKRALATIVSQSRDLSGFFAQMLFESMKGLGTDDSTLIRVVVSRAEVDLQTVSDEFGRRYKKTLKQFIKGDTSGSYFKLLRNIVGFE